MARGELQCIGATTLDDYRKYVERDPALERRLQPVRVEEPSADETVEILNAVKDRYEDHHNVNYTDDAIYSAAHLAARFISDRFLPDKAIDLIDEAGSRVRLRGSVTPGIGHRRHARAGRGQPREGRGHRRAALRGGGGTA